MLKRFRTIVPIALVAVMVMAIPARPATASEPTHCVVRLEPVGPGVAPGSISTVEVDGGCYSTLAEAVAVGTGGRVQLPVSTQPKDLTQTMIDENTISTLAGDTLIGTEWDDTGYGGGSKDYFANAGCANNTWEDPQVGSTWNDRFESGKGFANCDHNRKFQHANFGGDVRLCTPNCSTYGALRNEVSSLRWKD